MNQYESNIKWLRYESATLLILIHLFLPVMGSGAKDFNPQNIKFNQITVNEGLPNNRVDCMIQDYEGYLWFGTKRGLCRYNGYDFKNYTSILNDTTSLRYHQISCLLESSDSTLWIGTWHGGLHKYNKVEDNFTRITLPVLNETDNNSITSLYEDSKGGIWITADSKLYLLKNERTQQFKKIFYPDNRTLLANVSSVFEDNQGTVFITTDNNTSLFTYNHTIGTTAIFNTRYLADVLTGRINQIFSFDEENLWFAANNGLFNFNKVTREISIIERDNAPAIGTAFNFILETSDNNIWMGGNALYEYDKAEKKFTKFVHEERDPKTYFGNIITCGLQDNQKNLWFGSFNQGLNVIYNKTKHFNRNNKLAEKLENTSKNITAIYKNKDGYLFLGTWDKKGLLIVNEKNEFVQSNHDFSELSHLNEKIIRTITTDKNGIIWIGSEESVLTRFNPTTKQSKIYQIPGASGISESQITSIIDDKKNNIWVANPRGVYLFDPEQGTFKNQLNSANTQKIAEDDKGNIWCANYNSELCRINTNNTVSYFKSEDKNTNLPDERFVCVFKDSKDRMWVGTEFNGLFLYLPDSNKFRQFTVNDGLPSNDICSIEEDSKGRLWIGTNNGLSRFNYSLKDFSNYFRSDGMNADEFHYNSSFKSESGEIYFGCTNGIVFFNPFDIQGNPFSFPVKIEEIVINYGEVTKDINGISVGEAVRKNIPFKLKYNQNTINFQYTNLNFSKSKKSNFEYQLDGLDKDFNKVKQKRQVTYTNLKPGKYVFKVKATNNDNFGEQEAEIAFLIKNPPWLSWWAYTLYGLIAIIIFYGLRYQVRHEEKMKAAVRLERIEKDKAKELNQMKLRFFTNISHEFKTPLTLIIGPLEQIIEELHGNSSIKNKLKQISVNSKRLLELINQLIDFRKIEQDVLPLKKTRNDLLETTHKIMQAFNPVAIKNEILFTLDSDFEVLYFNYDEDKMEKILTNILSNAFKHTSKGGAIAIRIGHSSEEKVNITLSDTGSGIAPDKMKRIFDRYNNSASGTNHLELQSSGIGLAYSKKLVELHKGTLEIESTPDKGTSLSIELPYNRTLEEISRDTKIGEPKPNILVNTDEIAIDKEAGNSVDLSSAPNILVVEDDEELRKYIVSILRDIYRVEEAGDGQVGYKLAQKNDYDLIVSDVMMPYMSGTQLCSKLKSNIKTSHIPVILLTAKSDLGSKTEGYETGADSYLTKPFVPTHLMQVIKNLLNTRQHIMAYFTSKENKTDEPLGIHPRDKQFITDAITLIEKKIDEENFTVEFLGKELGLSRTHLFRKFKSLTGTAPNDFIRQVRLKKAAELIADGNYTISEIAYMVGFSNPANFSTSFKAFYGKSPKAFYNK